MEPETSQIVVKETIVKQPKINEGINEGINNKVALQPLPPVVIKEGRGKN